MSDNRTEFRVRASGRGKISLPEEAITIDCVVHDISPSGACLEIDRLAASIPELFAIVPDDGDDLGYACRVVWRNGNRIGIKFE